jgi:hypothetical protein
MVIEFVSANAGGLEFFGESAGIWCKAGYGSNVEECAEIIAKYGLASVVQASSSMDFASEYGFAEDNGANVMFQYAIKESGV